MKKGFTLAEVLITLSVIGVVAILTIPELVKNMNDYAFGKSREVTLAKIKEATNQMKSNDVLSGYATNDDFVNEFQKYMKITKRCDSSTLANCFSAKFKTASGDDIDTTTLTVGTKLGADNIAGNTVGLMIANGTSLLVTLRDAAKVGTDCDRIDPVDNQANTTSCLSFLYDINGYGSPNMIGKDIGTVNAAVSSCDGTKINAFCVDTVDLIGVTDFSAIASGSAEYNALKARGLISYDSGYGSDYWAGAIKACDARGMRLPTMSELAEMYNNYRSGNAVNMSFFLYKASTEYDATGAGAQNFNDGSTLYGYKNNPMRVRCVK